MTIEIRVVLIGGTSHVGKSTLAARVAGSLGWSYLSTDQLARHPGRPWRDDDKPLPADVVAYYTALSGEQQLIDVVEHYKQNVYPIADAMIRSRLNNPYDPGLVLEGSALLPDSVFASTHSGVKSVWLTEPDELITSRILASSSRERRSASEGQLIDAFIDRSTSLNGLIRETAAGNHQPCTTFTNAVEFLSEI